MDILCVGQIAADVLVWPVEKLDFNIDTTRIEGVKLSCGGDCQNTSIALKKLGNDLEIVSQVGQDVFGQFLVDQLNELGIPTDGIGRHPTAPTTVAIVMINAASARVFYYLPGACDELRFEDVPRAKIESAKIVHMGGFYQLKNLDADGVYELMKTAKELGKTTSMDVTWATDGNWKRIEKVLPYLDYFMPSYNEAKEIAGETGAEAIAQKLRQMGAKNIILKLGADGGYADTGSEQFFFPAYDVPVVDTTGAGDCFAAGMLTGLAKGWDIRRCTQFASAVSAFGIQSIGATTGIPSFDEVEAFIRLNPQAQQP